jgi:hypothetical protein
MYVAGIMTELFADGFTRWTWYYFWVAKLVKYSDVVTDVTNGDLTYVQFSPAIAFPADSIFYIGIDFGLQSRRYYRTCTGSGKNRFHAQVFLTAVEQWGSCLLRWVDGILMRPGDSLETSNLILPIICNDVLRIGYHSCKLPEVCKNKPKTITASGATTLQLGLLQPVLDCTTCAVVTFDHDATTTYTVTGDGGECTAEVTVVVKTTPTSNFTIGACSGGSVLLTRTGTPSVGVTYKWFRNGVKLTGSASTGSTYNATISGDYKVKTTITETNCSKVSGEKTVTISCKAGDNSSFTAEAYPNPFSQSVTINMASGSTELANVRLVDLSGRTLREFTGVDTSAPFEINENLAPGVYFVRVSQGSTEKMIKIIKE